MNNSQIAIISFIAINLLIFGTFTMSNIVFALPFQNNAPIPKGVCLLPGQHYNNYKGKCEALTSAPKTGALSALEPQFGWSLVIVTTNVDVNYRPIFIPLAPSDIKIHVTSYHDCASPQDSTGDSTGSTSVNMCYGEYSVSETYDKNKIVGYNIQQQLSPDCSGTVLRQDGVFDKECHVVNVITKL